MVYGNRPEPTELTMLKRYHISGDEGDEVDGFYTFAYRKVKMINIYKGI